jgi:hypothetical protein
MTTLTLDTAVRQQNLKQMPLIRSHVHSTAAATLAPVTVPPARVGGVGGLNSGLSVIGGSTSVDSNGIHDTSILEGYKRRGGMHTDFGHESFQVSPDPWTRNKDG